MQYAGADNILTKTSNEKKDIDKNFWLSQKGRTMLRYNNNVKIYKYS